MYKTVWNGDNISQKPKGKYTKRRYEDMEEKKRYEKQARTLYVVLAGMLVVIMVLSVITAVNKRKDKNPAPLDSTAETTYGKIETKPATTTRTPVVTAPVEDVTSPVITDRPVDAPPEEDEPVSAPRVYVLPTDGNVIKSYSVDLPVYSATMNDYRAHTGIDIFAEVGIPVYSFTDGVVKDVYNDPMMGTTISVDHGEGLVSYYQNLDAQAAEGIKAGAKVSAGDALGCVGQTTLVELSDASHLHFEIRKDGKSIDPAEYLSALKQTSAPSDE